jgi:hypothetical protein
LYGITDPPKEELKGDTSTFLAAIALLLIADFMISSGGSMIEIGL